MRKGIDTLIVPISGALTPKIKIPRSLYWSIPDGEFKRAVFTPANQQFHRLQKRFEGLRLPGLEVSYPIVLPKLGIQDQYKTLEHVSQKITERQKDHRAERVWLVGLSLGGTMVSPLVAQDKERAIIAGGHTGDSPHIGANESAFDRFKRALNIMEMLKIIDPAGFDGNTESFQKDTWNIATDNEATTEGRLFHMGADGIFVPTESALYPLPGASLHLLVPEVPEGGLHPAVNHIETAEVITHTGSVGHPDAVDFIVSSTLQALGYGMPGEYAQPGRILVSR